MLPLTEQMERDLVRMLGREGLGAPDHPCAWDVASGLRLRGMVLCLKPGQRRTFLVAGSLRELGTVRCVLTDAGRAEASRARARLRALEKPLAEAAFAPHQPGE